MRPDTNADELPCCEASERNKAAILETLTKLLPSRPQRVFEVGSGTGQHAVWFGQNRPQWIWQTSELASNIELLRRRLQQHRLSNLPKPIAYELGSDRPTLDTEPWDLMFTANTLHIIDTSLLPAVFETAATMLNGTGRLACYGPFSEHGIHNSEGNQAFDLSLRSQGYGGVRDLVDLDDLGARHGLRLTEQIEMPASNRLLVFC